jgi:type VI secretion system protein ImpM
VTNRTSIRGFYGKLPAFGDFVGRNLPRPVIDAWDRWLQTILPASRELLGEPWHDIWMEAPIWRFCLRPGSCGPVALTGLWMPSIDRAGREFPLMVAATLPTGFATAGNLECDPWLDAAESAALDALTSDLPPDVLAARLNGDRVAPMPGSSSVQLGSEDLWWTSGSPLVTAGHRVLAELPDVDQFAAMLDGRRAALDAALSPSMT